MLVTFQYTPTLHSKLVVLLSWINFKFEKLKRIGINYANKKDINAKLRFKIKEFV